MGDQQLKKAFGTHEIARLCHVTPPTVIRWIEEGKIPFFTTGGGHRRVWQKDLVIFMKAHNIPLTDVLPDSAPQVVLIVDDEADNRRFIRRALSVLLPDAVIEEAIDGFDAANKLHTLNPVLVVLDVKLPKVDGLELCAMIRSNSRLRTIKVLAISGCAQDETMPAMIASGADDYLAKPFLISELSQKIETLLKGL